MEWRREGREELQRESLRIMADISLDTIKDFFSLRPLSKPNAVTSVKITGRNYEEGKQNVYQQQFKMPKKNVQR